MAAAEQKKSYAVIKAFKGLNTKANRTAIDETEFAWLENAMPIGSGNIKIVPAQVSVNSFSFSNTVTFLFSANIADKDYIITGEDNGESQYFQIAPTSGANGVIATAGTFSSTGLTGAQWKNELIVLGDPDKGLYYWGGNSAISIGSVGLLAIANPGSGYVTPPDVTISAPNDANGVQATAVATISAGSGGVDSIIVDNAGSSYTSVPNVVIGSPNLSNGVQATAAAAIAGGAIVYITVNNPGSGYTSTPNVTISGGGGSSGNAVAIIGTGKVTSVSLTNAGTGYTSPPTVTLTGGGGTGANVIAQINTFKTGTVSVILTNGGSGYTNVANISVSIGNATGWTTQATAVATLSGNAVNQIVMTNPGAGYTASSNVVVTITGGGGANAAAKAVVNTDQVVDVATFSGRLWAAAGRTVYYTAADSYSDFTSISAGSFTITDSTLHGNIKSLLSANNFLYIFGDDSINVFSDVRVNAAGVTVFTNTNVSASVGSRRIYAVFPYFRSVLFMNDYGVYALVGSTTSKISDPLDGVFPYIDFTLPVTGGQVLLNNILCAAFNFTYKDPTNNGTPRQVQAVFFEKKWFITSQGSINYVTSVPVGGFINLYGVADKALYQLYGDASANVSSMVQTALLPMGDNIRTKQALKFAIEATLANAATLSVTVDSETGSSPAYTLTNTVDWINNVDAIIPWQNNSSVIIPWVYTKGYALYKSDAQQYGKYLGLTMTSNNAAFVVNTFEFEHELRVRF
jgi:P pilus assembly chaperone PapD